MIVVGEIGLSRQEFLHDIRLWELRSIIRGSNRRNREMWSAIRWHAHINMLAQNGSKWMQENGLTSPHDILPLPWDKRQRIVNEIPTDDEVKRLQEEMRQLNMQNKSSEE